MDSKTRSNNKNNSQGWDKLCDWYDGWMGQHGSQHHRALAIPHLMALLEPRKGEAVLDVGAGQGVLAPYIARSGASYTGIDISRRMIQRARKRHGGCSRFIAADARELPRLPQFQAAQYDAAVFLLSIQDMDPLERVLSAVGWALKSSGRLAILMTHPCFRMPRQSGWGWDPQRRLQYRRIDRYLTPLQVPMKQHPGGRSGASISFHRPLMEYINALGQNGLALDRMVEISSRELEQNDRRKGAQKRAEAEIPLFLGLRARKH